MIAAALGAGALAGAAAARAARRLRLRLPPLPPAPAGWGIVAAGGIAGTVSALALGDPLLVPLGCALGWGGAELIRRVLLERQVLDRTRAALPFLQRFLQEVEAGTHPVSALSWATQSQATAPWLGARIEALGAGLARGEPLGRAAAAWARQEEIPVLRLFAHLLSTHAMWGTNLGAGLRRVLREADQSVAFGTEERTEHRLYEALTVAFLALDLVLGATALLGWPHTVPSPYDTPWGRALLIGSGLLTALAVSVPVSLASGTPPRLRPLGGAKEQDRG